MQARVAPQHDDQLVDYLLDTEAPEMEYEVARLRPRLGADFFATLDRMIGMGCAFLWTRSRCIMAAVGACAALRTRVCCGRALRCAAQARVVQRLHCASQRCPRLLCRSADRRARLPRIAPRAGTERLCVVPGQAPNEERLAELEGLRAYLNAAAAAVDSATALVAAPADRLKALLAAPDKKAALLELAGECLAGDGGGGGAAAMGAEANSWGPAGEAAAMGAEANSWGPAGGAAAMGAEANSWGPAAGGAAAAGALSVRHDNSIERDRCTAAARRRPPACPRRLPSHPPAFAGNNEIDEGLLTLLQQNIEGAREAGQPEAADFMQKILTAALRYRV